MRFFTVGLLICDAHCCRRQNGHNLCSTQNNDSNDTVNATKKDVFLRKTTKKDVFLHLQSV